jgi:putative oxidoreductase
MLSGDFGFADPIGVGEEASLILTVFAEFVCGILLAIGLFTRAALVPLMVTMVVAVFIIHADDPFSKQEFGLLYLIPYVTLFLTGPGKLSLDKKLG